MPARNAFAGLLMQCLRDSGFRAVLEEVRAAVEGLPASRSGEAATQILAEAGFARDAPWTGLARHRLASYAAAVSAAPVGVGLSARLSQARELFRAQLYFEVHEVLEPPWMKAVGREKAWLQGLIQAAVAWHHADSGNCRGARSLSAAALEKLGDAPDVWNGFEIGIVRRAVDGLTRWLVEESGRSKPDRPFVEGGR